jgi:hypothetical protein
LQRPSSRQHKKCGMRINDRFLQPDRAEPQHIAHENNRDLHYHHGEKAPGDAPSDRGCHGIDPVGERAKVRQGHFGFP